jgi:hypothetical protein
MSTTIGMLLNVEVPGKLYVLRLLPTKIPQYAKASGTYFPMKDGGLYSILICENTDDNLIKVIVTDEFKRTTSTGYADIADLKALCPDDAEKIQVWT